jgi:hypothetical protein
MGRKNHTALKTAGYIPIMRVKKEMLVAAHATLLIIDWKNLLFK